MKSVSEKKLPIYITSLFYYAMMRDLTESDMGAETSTSLQMQSKMPTSETKSEKFLKSLYAKAAEKGYTPTQLVNHCLKIDQLENKYSKTFEELKDEYVSFAKEMATKDKKIGELDSRITEINSKHQDLMRKFSVEEGQLRDYVEVRKELGSLGLAVNDLQRVKNCLYTIKNEDFDPKTILAKLNKIENLESRKNDLTAEFEDKEKNYKEKETALVKKISELEKNYERQRQEIQAYLALRERGVDGDRIVAWNKLLSEAELDFGTVESELGRQKNLQVQIDEASKRLEEIENRENALKASVKELTLQKRALESSISQIKDSSLKELEASRSSFVSITSQTMEQAKKISESAKTEIEATLSRVKSATLDFEGSLSKMVEKAREETKKQSELIVTAERIGKYDSILPILKLVENGDIRETEGLVSMGCLSNAFVRWMEKHQGVTNGGEILESFKKASFSLDRAIQTVGT